jgi:hypothetical protein
MEGVNNIPYGRRTTAGDWRTAAEGDGGVRVRDEGEGEGTHGLFVFSEEANKKYKKRGFADFFFLFIN